MVAFASLPVAGCAAPEQPLLERFFAASRFRDRTLLQSLATVTFEPREQGIVRTFEITGMTRERSIGGTSSKDITITAPVTLPDGQTVQKTLVVTIERARDDRMTLHPWIVVGVAER